MTIRVNRAVPSAPGRLPLLGNSLSLLRKDGIDYLTSLRSIGHVVALRIGTRPYLLLNSPDLVHAVMVTESKCFDRGRIFDKARPYVGDGLFTAEGAEHNRQRRMVQPAFHRDRVRRRVTVMSEVARQHVASWRHGDPIDVGREMHVLASELICRSMFRAPQAREVVQLARDELPALVAGLGIRAVLPDLFSRLPIPANRRFDAACANLRAATRRLVTAYREQPDDPDDFVSLLLRAHDARTGTTPHDTEIRDQVMTLLIAGIETPATTLTWALYELAAHPDVLRGIEEEVDGVLDGRNVAPDDLAALRRTEAFVLESLRLHHPLWLLMRRAVKPVTIGGVRIEPGTEVIYSPAAMHRDPALFSDPMRMHPQRWLDDTPSSRTHPAFIPFGLGNRQCIGDAFALVQMKITLAAVVADRRLTLPAGYRPKTVISSIVHLDRLPMVVEKR